LLGSSGERYRLLRLVIVISLSKISLLYLSYCCPFSKHYGVMK
jgi:hypothetical protein